MQQRNGKGAVEQKPKHRRDCSEFTRPKRERQHPEIQQQEQKREIPHQPAQRKAADQRRGRTEISGNEGVKDVENEQAGNERPATEENGHGRSEKTPVRACTGRESALGELVALAGAGLSILLALHLAGVTGQHAGFLQ